MRRSSGFPGILRKLFHARVTPEGVLSVTGKPTGYLLLDKGQCFVENYRLHVEYRWLKAKGNSGIFYRATTEYDEVYWSGSEYQLLDDANTPDGKNLLTAAGSDYALYPASAYAAKPHDEWNTSRLIVNGAHVEHWLNGQKVLQYELWSPDWKARVAASKFKAYPNYGLAKRGHIGIQGDHPGVVAFRNIRIQELP